MTEPTNLITWLSIKGGLRKDLDIEQAYGLSHRQIVALYEGRHFTHEQLVRFLQNRVEPARPKDKYPVALRPVVRMFDGLHHFVYAALDCGATIDELRFLLKIKAPRIKQLRRLAELERDRVARLTSRWTNAA